MLALVTGGTGFIGGALVRRLRAERQKVRVFSRSGKIPEDLSHGDISAVRGDLEEPGSLLRALEGVDVFYHVGEIKNVSRTASEKNVRLIETVVPRLAGTGVERIVFVSSITVSGIPSAFPADEDTPPRIALRDYYTAYKRRCEEILAAAAPGRFAVIRPAPVYGPGSRYLGRLVNTIEKIGSVGMPFIGSGRNCAPLIFVKDLAGAIYLAGVRPEAAGRTLILTDGMRHSWHEFLSAVAGRMGRRLRIVPVPPLLLKISAAPFDLFCGFFGMELDALKYIDYFTRDLFFENTRARELLGWQPEYTIERGVAEMVDYYLDRSKRG